MVNLPEKHPDLRLSNPINSITYLTLSAVMDPFTVFMSEIINHLGWELVWGGTELVPSVMGTPLGRPLPGVRNVKIRDHSRRALPRIRLG